MTTCRSAGWLARGRQRRFVLISLMHSATSTWPAKHCCRATWWPETKWNISFLFSYIPRTSVLIQPDKKRSTRPHFTAMTEDNRFQNYDWASIFVKLCSTFYAPQCSIVQPRECEPSTESLTSVKRKQNNRKFHTAIVFWPRRCRRFLFRPSDSEPTLLRLLIKSSLRLREKAKKSLKDLRKIFIKFHKCGPWLIDPCMCWNCSTSYDLLLLQGHNQYNCNCIYYLSTNNYSVAY